MLYNTLNLFLRKSTMRLKQLREERKLSQKDVAKVLDTSQQNYNRYEYGKVKLCVDKLIELANYYDVSLDYLCERQWLNKVDPIPDNKINLINLVLKLNERQTDKAEAYITALTDDT